MDLPTGYWWRTVVGWYSPWDKLNICVWTHCISAPNATDGTNLTHLIYKSDVYSHAETEVELGDKVVYYCFNGMKSVNDFNFEYQEATCGSNGGYDWSAPGTWTACTDSN